MGVGFLFSSIISSMCALTISAIAPWLFKRVQVPVQLDDSDGGAGRAVGDRQRPRACSSSSRSAICTASTNSVRYLIGTLKVSIIITLVFGIFGTLIELLQVRLDDATVALRTKERDEAEARRLAAEAQLASIESRVQPHFLFNTLNSIAALVHDDPAGAERMTGQLASLLRSALDSTAMPLVPLEQELRVVRAYLDIERVRFGDRLRYDVDLGDGAESAIVPRMALQTLVENSVKYAVSPRREGGSICVTAERPTAASAITVEDDGPGFDAAHRPEGHGLALLDARLAMLFGDRRRDARRQPRRPHRRHARRSLLNPQPAIHESSIMMIRAYVVDDERLAVERLTRLLNATGRVTIAGSSTDPEAALAFLRDTPVDVLFLDIQMPGLTGFELLERLDRDVAGRLHDRLRPLRDRRVRRELARLSAQADRSRAARSRARQARALRRAGAAGRARAGARARGAAARRTGGSSGSRRASASGRRCSTSRGSAISRRRTS